MVANIVECLHYSIILSIDSSVGSMFTNGFSFTQALLL